MNNKFDDIRPYYDEEIPAAMQRIASASAFPLLASFVFPGKDLESVRNLVRSISSISEFQFKVMYYANEQIIKKTITEFSYGGLENLDTSKNYLFVSNHRDIMLDDLLLALEYLLLELLNLLKNNKIGHLRKHK